MVGGLTVQGGGTGTSSVELTSAMGWEEAHSAGESLGAWGSREARGAAEELHRTPRQEKGRHAV